ncbi:unnamed protein product [Mycena citricolor]|nr:unnamed protein product [Mycena citricolor]
MTTTLNDGFESGDDDEPFRPTSADGDSTSSAAAVETTGKRKKKVKAKATRSAVFAARLTQNRTGTPQVSVEHAPTLHHASKKHKPSKKAGLAMTRPNDSDDGGDELDPDAMLRYGGPALDNDVQESVERRSDQRNGLPNQIVKVGAPHRVTQKSQRVGGGKKWTPDDLPAGVATRFKSVFQAFIRAFTGTLEPWASPTVQEVQEAVNTIYGAGLYRVEEDNVWYVLTSYRLGDWRRNFFTRACDAMLAYIKYSNDRDEEIKQQKYHELLVDHPNLKYKDVTDDDDELFHMRTPKEIAEFVAAMLEMEDDGTYAFHWETYGEKKGLFMNYLILATFSYHLTILDAVPSQCQFGAHPYGAVLLAVQAVQRMLNCYKTGLFVVPNGKDPEQQFSADNYADKKVRREGRVVLDRRGTKYLHTIQAWSNAKWERFLAGAREYKVKAKGNRASSAASSEPEDIIDVDAELMILSD